jgi:Transposase DDE domain
VTHHPTHLIGAAVVTRGPCNDAALFGPAVEQAVRHFPITTLLADAAGDSEKFHVLCRETLNIARTVVPIIDRRGTNFVPTTPYRRAMKLRFPHKKYVQRWQVESVFSRLKRRLGDRLRARTFNNRQIECQLRVLTYNLMILRFLSFSTEQFEI